MDQDWDPSDPTMAISLGKPSESEVEEFRSALIEATGKAKETPYLYLPWLDRAVKLTQLGYPELAAADAIHFGDIVRFTTAMYIIFAQKNIPFDVCETYMRFAIKKLLWLVRARAAVLLKLRAFPDVMRISSEALYIYAAIKDPSETEKGIQRRLSDRIHYAQQEFNKCAQHYAEDDMPFEAQKQFLSFGFGYIRTYHWVLIRGEIVMTETHPFAMFLEQSETQCMNCFTPLASATSLRMMECCPKVAYCSAKCGKSAMDNYHSTIYGKDFSSIINRTHSTYGGKAEGAQYNDGSMELGNLSGWNDGVTDKHKHSQFPFPDHAPIFMIRILAMCVQASYDPLSHPNIDQLKPNEGPLGIHVFANHNFDTWVILSMWYRIMNNSTSATMDFPNRIMAPNHCWFNHSCNPNASMVLPRSGRFSDTEIVALRDIEEDEKVFVSYITPEDFLGAKEDRQKKLESWLHTSCNCSRCHKQ
ncbi:uncharacterized protein PAC_14135 [Phialocephala subalpina]|uniref:SET domain-containing protein n=1 Tax=Phialocephala subalpina TaxID=576137 RepID=A0A1L7XH13_9HELO|nr:uncharacterized protein PAC_14135 [Phialocephala subalpina]